MSVKISDLSSIFLCVQRYFPCVHYYLCVHNLIYVRPMLFTLRCQINVPPAYYFWEIWTPSPLLATYLDLLPHLSIYKTVQVLYKKIDIYNTTSYRCSRANSLRIFRTPPNSRGMPLYLKYNVYFVIQSQQDVLYP